METINPIYLFVNVVLFIGSLLFWIMQRFYKATLVFALVQLGSAFFVVEYLRMNMQELLSVMGIFYALSTISIMIYARIRLNSALKHSKDRPMLDLKKG